MHVVYSLNTLHGNPKMRLTPKSISSQHEDSSIIGLTASRVYMSGILRVVFDVCMPRSVLLACMELR